jgi:hypothetical protein
VQRIGLKLNQQVFIHWMKTKIRFQNICLEKKNGTIGTWLDDYIYILYYKFDLCFFQPFRSLLSVEVQSHPPEGRTMIS